MLCSISGEAPETPVVSKKSGNIYEKRLIESYVAEKGTDPVTGEELSLDDLVEVKTDRVVRPRPPTLTSIPSLLAVFQNEWDSVALESFTLKQQLAQTRQELSTALYHNDAAVRVIARLTRERDEARDALSRLSIHDRAATERAVSNGDAMQVDGQALPEAIMSRIEARQEELSKTRRKRPVPEGWATPDIIQALDTVSAIAKAVSPLSRALALHKNGTTVLVGGSEGELRSLILGKKKTTVIGNGLGFINDVLWWDTKAVVAAADGAVKVFSGNKEVVAFSEHAGPATSIALHPVGDLLASVGSDKSFVFYNLEISKKLIQVFTDSELSSCDFHPDGHLFAAGGSDGNIKIFDVKNLSNAANFECSGPIQSLKFSENGTWLAVAVQGSSNVGIWDLRKSVEIKSVDFGSNVSSVNWDYTGQYLLVAGLSGISVAHYDKTSKTWSTILSKAVPSTTAQWGLEANSIVYIAEDGSLGHLQ